MKFGDTPLMDFIRDRLHRETQRTFGDYALTTAWTPAGQLQHHHLSLPQLNRDYGWNADGQLTGIRGPHEQRDYRYDGAGRLLSTQITSAQHTLSQLSLSDPAGNRVADRKTFPALPQSWPANRISEDAHCFYHYDGHGRLTEKDERRIHPQGSITHHYGYDHQSRQWLTQCGLSVEQMEKQLEPEHTPERKIHLYHCDHRGLPLALIDEAGAIAWQAEYDEWGNQLSEENPHHLQQLIRLPGQQVDEEKGLYYNRHRYYDPQQGRYITQDPIGLNGGWNLYCYTSNPVQQSDPLGLSDNWGTFFSLGTVGGVDYGEAAESAGPRLSSDESVRALSNMASTEGAWTPGSEYAKAWAINTPITGLTAIYGPAASLVNILKSSTIFCSANVTYQLVEYGEVNPSDAFAAALTGVFYPGRSLGANTLIASGIAYLNTGSNGGAVGAGTGSFVSGLLGKIPLLSNVIGDYATGLISEGTSDNVGSSMKKDNDND